MLSQRSIGAAGIGPLPSDDEFNTVSFLSHFDGTNNGDNNAFDDSSTSNHTITANGNATQGSFGPFARPDGEWGVAFPRPNLDNQNIYAAWNDADTAFGTGDFTVELFVFISVVPGSGDYANVFDFRTGSNTNHIDLYFGDNSKRLIYFAGGNTVFTSSTDLPIGEWVHLALVRSSGTTTLYQNGVSVGSASNTTNFSASIFRFGSRYTDNFGMTGSISNTRVVKGSAVYTSAFTPATSPLTAITNTVFLSAQSNRFVDNSASAHTVNGVNSPSVSAFGPFLTDEVYDPAVNGASWYCEAQGDYLSMSTGGTALQNPSNFTLEGWIYMKQTPASGISTAIFAQGNAGQDALYNSYSVGVRDDLLPRVVTSGYQQETIRSSTAINLNEWAHLALTWDGTTWSLYQNGVREGTSTSQPISTTTYNQAYFGRDYYSDARFAPKSFYSDIRMVTSLLYTGSTYTVPTAPLTAVANTQLLVHCKEAQAIDSAAQNNLTLVGNAKISNTQSKFGGTSFYVPANGDYLKLPGETDTGNFGTGNFTIEMWIYRTTSGVVQMLIDSRSGATASDYQTQITAGNELRSRFGGVASTTATVPVNEWVHIAIVRNNGTVTQYINGTGGGSYASTANLTVTSSGLTLGGSAIQSGSIAGYVDDLRISKGVARYTSNFTAPTEPFADKGQ